MERRFMTVHGITKRQAYDLYVAYILLNRLGLNVAEYRLSSGNDSALYPVEVVDLDSTGFLLSVQRLIELPNTRSYKEIIRGLKEASEKSTINFLQMYYYDVLSCFLTNATPPTVSDLNVLVTPECYVIPAPFNSLKNPFALPSPFLGTPVDLGSFMLQQNDPALLKCFLDVLVKLKDRKEDIKESIRNISALHEEDKTKYCEFIENKYQDMQVMLCETVMSLPFVMERVDRLFSDYARYIHKASDWIEVYGLNQMLDALSTYDWISH